MKVTINMSGHYMEVDNGFFERLDISGETIMGDVTFITARSGKKIFGDVSGKFVFSINNEDLKIIRRDNIINTIIKN